MTAPSRVLLLLALAAIPAPARSSLAECPASRVAFYVSGGVPRRGRIRRERRLRGSGCHGWFGAQLGQGPIIVSRFVIAGFTGRESLVETLSFPLSIAAGEDFELEFMIWFYRSPGAAHHGARTARLRFGGFPAGAEIRSCYGMGGVTPVRATS